MGSEEEWVVVVHAPFTSVRSLLFNRAALLFTLDHEASKRLTYSDLSKEVRIDKLRLPKVESNVPFEVL